MFRSLLRWWRSRHDRAGVFRYSDGAETRIIDPTLALDGLNAALPDWPDLASLAGSTPQLPPDMPETLVRQRLDAQVDAARDLAKAARGVFAIPPVASGGLTETQCLALLGTFVEYVNALRGEARPLSLWPPRGRSRGGRPDASPPDSPSAGTPSAAPGPSPSATAS